jgi:phenylacetate-CoA ligase
MTRAPSSQGERALSSMRAFYDADLTEFPGDDLALRRRVLSLFRDAATRVPAYRHFLAEHGVDPNAVTTLEAFASVPATSKADYHQRYPLADLCRDGALDRCDFLAVSSGSTGAPTVWPRFVADEMGTAARFEQVLADGFDLAHHRTLGVVCFALGSWVGGMFTTAACRHVAAKGYPLTLVTPGNNRAEILRTVRTLGPMFDQVVLFGYPPFLKDVVDAGRAEGIDWGDFRARIVTAGEVFSEEWRTLMAERLGAPDPLRFSASLYGTADGGVLANETALSIRIRRLLAAHPAAARTLFGQERLPTLCQYDPFHRYFEADGDQLLFTGDSGAPLIRYRILDQGGVIPFAAMIEFLRAHDLDPIEGEGAVPARALPFVYVFGRSGFAVSFYGANVYPENVSVGLEQPEIAPHVTGKFVVEVRRSDDLDAEFEVVVELAHGAAPPSTLEADVARSVRVHLERLNSEFLTYAPPERRTPRVRLLPLGDPSYFPIGVKHRYTRAT